MGLEMSPAPGTRSRAGKVSLGTATTPGTPSRAARGTIWHSAAPGTPSAAARAVPVTPSRAPRAAPGMQHSSKLAPRVVLPLIFGHQTSFYMAQAICRVHWVVQVGCQKRKTIQARHDYRVHIFCIWYIHIYIIYIYIYKKIEVKGEPIVLEEPSVADVY